MRNILKFLSTIWLIMALVTAPVQALNASPGQVAGPCKMHIDSPDASGADCPFCTDRSCSADSCPNNSCCSATHVQPGMFATLHFINATSAEIPGPAPVFATGSGTSPPPLPPPV